MECMKIAREWLRNCLDNHDSCRGPAGSDRRLPSRVIDVGDEEHDPKLVVTDHAVGEYAVLSYCWGKSTHQHVTLSLQNLDAFQKLIPISSLPMTPGCNLCSKRTGHPILVGRCVVYHSRFGRRLDA